MENVFDSILRRLLEDAGDEVKSGEVKVPVTIGCMLKNGKVQHYTVSYNKTR